MSTFAVFGMTRNVALEEARRTVKTTRRTPLGEQGIPMSEWLRLCEKRADEIMEGSKVKQLSVLLDAPQYAEEFISVARKTLQCRDLHIKCKVVLTNERGEPLKDKNGAPKVGWQLYGQSNRSAA